MQRHAALEARTNSKLSFDCAHYSSEAYRLQGPVRESDPSTRPNILG